MAKKRKDEGNQEKLTPEMKELLAEIEKDPALLESADANVQDSQRLIGTQEDESDADIELDSSTVRAKAGKYITFTLDGEDYGLYILSVKEIIGMMSVTRVPRTPDFVRGVINLRGKVHPVIELRKRFGLEPKEDNARTPIIIVEVNQSKSTTFLGIVVDSVSEVINVIDDQLEATPTFGVDLETDFILGLAKVDKRVITLLDIDRILTSRQLVMVQETT